MIKYIILIVAIFSNVSAQISLRYGMRTININRSSNFYDKVLEISSNRYVWQGLIFYGVGFSLYLYILSKFDVSYIYPIITASIFILLVTFSSLILNEPITVKKIVGILIIILGIIISS